MIRDCESLDRAARTLAEEDAVIGILPEGRTHDDLHLARLKSGAARLAMKAALQGAGGLRVVTMELNYERKEKVPFGGLGTGRGADRSRRAAGCAWGR